MHPKKLVLGPRRSGTWRSGQGGGNWDARVLQGSGRSKRNQHLVIYKICFKCTGCSICSCTWIGFAWILRVPLYVCAKWEFGISGWATGQDGGTLRSKSTKPRCISRWDTLYVNVTKTNFFLKAWTGSSTYSSPTSYGAWSRETGRQFHRKHFGLSFGLKTAWDSILILWHV